MHTHPPPLALSMALAVALLPAPATAQPDRQAPAAAPDRLRAAVDIAAARAKRLAVLWTAADSDVTDRATRLAKLKIGDAYLRYEFEVVAADAEHATVAAELGTEVPHRLPTLTVHDPEGGLLAKFGCTILKQCDDDALGQLLHCLRTPMPAAREVYARARAEAEESGKQLLVHLAAPW